MVVNPNTVLEQVVTSGKDKCVVQQNGIDLTVAKIQRQRAYSDFVEVVRPCEREIGKWDDDPNEYFLVFPGETIQVYFEQGIEIPNNMCAQVVGRSSFARAGCIVWSGLFDAGFKTDACGCMLFNAGSNSVAFNKGDRLAQLVVHEADSASLYQGHWNGK